MRRAIALAVILIAAEFRVLRPPAAGTFAVADSRLQGLFRKLPSTAGPFVHVQGRPRRSATSNGYLLSAEIEDLQKALRLELTTTMARIGTFSGRPRKIPYGRTLDQDICEELQGITSGINRRAGKLDYGSRRDGIWPRVELLRRTYDKSSTNIASPFRHVCSAPINCSAICRLPAAIPRTEKSSLPITIGRLPGRRPLDDRA